MTTRSVSFTGAMGRSVPGRLEMPPDGEPRACAIFAHCFSCTSNHKAAVYVSRALAERQIAVLRFDFSEGPSTEDEGGGEMDRSVSSILAANVDDLVAAAAFLASELEAPALLIGHSLGGAAAIMAAQRIPTARAVATIGSPSRVRAIRGILPDMTADSATDDGLVSARSGGDEAEGESLEEVVGELKAALLIMHATDDRVVSLEHAARLYTAARHPKSFVALPDAGHLLLEQRDAEYAAGILAAWAERYFPPVEHTTKDEAERPTRVTVSTGAEGFRTEIGVRSHTLLADEPVSMGGTDSGPTPYDLLVAALGACTTMTLQLYARRKGWPLEEAVARLKHAKVYATDQEKSSDRPVQLDQVERELELKGPLDDAQRKRLMEIADRCPVHRTLEGSVTVRTSLMP